MYDAAVTGSFIGIAFGVWLGSQFDKIYRKFGSEFKYDCDVTMFSGFVGGIVGALAGVGLKTIISRSEAVL